jgi:lysophospholipase
MAEKRALQRSYPADGRTSEWSAADGWRLRRFDWPAEQPRGELLFLGGRGDVFEKYLETLDRFRRQGWSIRSLDWRGQGGSGRCSPLAHCGHIDRFDHFRADLGAYWRTLEREGRPMVVIGHSMGGFLTLSALAHGIVDPDAAILIAPMLGLKGPLPPAIGERMARVMCRVGDPARPAWKGNERPATTVTRQALLTRDTDRYEDELFWQQHDPRLMTGPPSWRWVAEAFAETRMLASDPRVATIGTPLLALIADHDGLVDAKAARRVLARAPDVEIVGFGRESAHEILREADPVRDRALAAIDDFLARRVTA